MPPLIHPNDFFAQALLQGKSITEAYAFQENMIKALDLISTLKVKYGTTKT